MSKQSEVQTKFRRAQKLTNPPRIDEADKGKLQSVFGMDEPIYTALRDCFYGFELDENQKGELKRIQPVWRLVRMIFLPEINKSIPFGSNYDLWQTQDMNTSDDANYPVFFKAKVKILEWLGQSLQRVENPDLQGVDIKIKADCERYFIIARNGYLSYVDQQIRFLMNYAIQNEMTEEEMKQLISQNSSR